MRNTKIYNSNKSDTEVVYKIPFWGKVIITLFSLLILSIGSLTLGKKMSRSNRHNGHDNDSASTNGESEDFTYQKELFALKNKTLGLYDELFSKIDALKVTQNSIIKINEQTYIASPTGGEKGYYSVQIGSFEDFSLSQKFAYYFQTKGYKVYIAETVIPEIGKRYRIRIGKFETERDAKIWRKKFEDEFNLPSFFVFEKRS